MKKGNRWVALLAAMLSVFFIVGCGGEPKPEANPAAGLIGSWSMECDLAEGMNALVGTEDAGTKTEFTVKVVFEFTQEGTYKMYIDRDSFVESFDGWLDNYVTYTAEDMYMEFQGEGLTKEDVDLIIEEEYGCSMTEYLQQTAEEQLDLDAMVEDMVSEGIYEVRGEKLHMSDGTVIDENRYDIYTIEGNTLTLDMPEGIEASAVFPGVEYPFVLTKETQ